ncbi:hypothetical protein [Microbispora siamensis]|uniref:FtsX-like permease family protein n=1 Tax=Microbispora siamensis TaxID=564413 RepID=A0ABQ4GXX8_9ACTN|nr:hypothetical protein [Microbispora siamensis]GIH66272.1 hypothetical protein Msi02_70890 [Microbispora siamensis]
MAAEILTFLFAGFGLGAVVLAARSVPSVPGALVRRRPLIWGSALLVSGCLIMALAAWSTHEDGHYDDFGSAMTLLVAMTGGALVLLGLGPFLTLLLGVAARCSVRPLPPVRLAACDLARDRARTVPAIVTMMLATALAVTVVIVAAAATEQNRADYAPQARPGALLVRYFSAADAPAALAAIQRVLPGVPVVQSFRQREIRPYSLHAGNVDLPERYGVVTSGVIGDGALLRYLTGDPSTPYEENTAVVVTADDVEVRSVTIRYDSSGGDATAPMVKQIPAVVARPADPSTKEVFLPAQVFRDLGEDLEPDELIVDPSVHGTSEIERQRLDRRLGGVAQTYVERGYQPPSGWRIVVAVAVVVALGGALVAAGGIPGARSRHVPRGAGSAARPRWSAACRAGLAAFIGTAVGVAAGCLIGLLLAWPVTTSSGWEPAPRVGFATPWPSIAALVAGLPVLAAAVAGSVRTAVWPVRSRTPTPV